jgi:hypothetical protein
MSGALLAVTLMFGAIGCNGQQSLPPTAPSAVDSSRPPAATIADGERWNLTTRLVSVTGRRCEEVVNELGEPLDWLLVIARAGESIALHLYLYGTATPVLICFLPARSEALSFRQRPRARVDPRAVTELGLTLQVRHGLPGASRPTAAR